MIIDESVSYFNAILSILMLHSQLFTTVPKFETLLPEVSESVDQRMITYIRVDPKPVPPRQGPLSKSCSER